MTAARVHTQLLLLSRLYLLLSLVLPEGIPPLGEVGQPQEVHHLPLSVDERREDGRVSEGAAVKVSKQHGGVRVNKDLAFWTRNVTTWVTNLLGAKPTPSTRMPLP